MKLQELAPANTLKHTAKVLESHFGDRLRFDSITKAQARGMLKRVRSLVNEHRNTPEFHYSEQNPNYLKLVMLENALAARVSEVMDPRQRALQMTQQQAQKRDLQDAIKAKQKEIAELQKQMVLTSRTVAAENFRNRRRALKESEIQQAQVILAAQDMVDQVQKMSEQVSAMQFKDLPALVDQIKNEVGVDQATQFNGDASAALSGLLQNLQGARQQLEAALGVVTGQAPTVPGMDDQTDLNVDIDAVEPPAEPGADLEEPDLSVDANLSTPAASLGRGRR
jgi:hypothetical protein